MGYAAIAVFLTWSVLARRHGWVDTWSVWARDLELQVLAVLFALTILGIANNDLAQRRSWLRHRVLVTLGTWSFAFYLVHATVMYAVGGAIGLQPEAMENLLWYPVLLALALAAAWALHRFVYYMELITIILAARNLLSEPSDADAGIALFGTLGGAMVAGHFLAVILTPVAHERMAPSRWTLVCLVVGTVGQLAVAVSYSTPVFIAGLFVFGIGVQGAKIAVDSIIQGDVEDAYRGRTFAIYDVMFNMSACLAAAVALLVLPDVGWSWTVQVGLAAFVWATAFGYWRSVRTLGDEPRRAGPTAAG